jgi:hypothetical protein
MPNRSALQQPKKLADMRAVQTGSEFSGSRSRQLLRPLSPRMSGRCHATFADFKAAILTFLREEVPRKWHAHYDKVTDNFRIISPKDFRILA